MKLFKPYMSWRARWYAFKVLLGTQLAEGPLVKKFEEEFAKVYKLHPDSCIAVNSGTSALELAYELAGISKGDEVITPVLTCTATNLPLVRRGAKIVFADITDQLLLDPQDVKKRITDKTKAIVYVDFGGASNTLSEIVSIAREHNLTLIQDSAQSVGPFFRPLGDYVCVSFQAIKTLTTGDGGMLIVNKDPLLARHARQLRWFGIDRPRKQREGDVDIHVAGYKYHMNDLAAAIGLGNLRSLSVTLHRRARIAMVYFTSGLPILPYPWLAILIHPKAKEIGEFLKTLGIETGQHHYRNDKYTVFGGRQYDLPMMDAIEDKYLLLPNHQGMSRLDALQIVQHIKTFLVHNQWRNE